MKRVLAAIMGAALVLPQPAAAQPFGQAVGATIKRIKDEMGDPVDWVAIEAARKRLINDVETWWDFLRKFMPPGWNIGEDRACYQGVGDQCWPGGFYGQGGQFGGGGATGSWDPSQPDMKPFGYCAELDMYMDAAGNLLVPAMPLVGGGPLKVADRDKYRWGDQDNTRQQTAGNVTADTPGAVALWWAHTSNVGTGSDASRWFGVTGTSGTYPNLTFHFARAAYYDEQGTLIPMATRSESSSPSTQVSPADKMTEPCPPADGGADFHFYYEGLPQKGSNGRRSCTWYAPNLSLSPSGYAYPKYVPIGIGTLNGSSGNRELRQCPVARSAIRLVADKIIKEHDRVTGEQTRPLNDSDVRECGKTVTVGDLRGKWDAKVPARVQECPNDQVKEPTQPVPGPEPSPTPTGTPTPTPTGPSSPGPDYSHPNVGQNPLDAPTGLSILGGLPDWFELPSINMTAGPCPVYAYEVPAWDWAGQVDIHCPLLEDNRQLISVLMLLAFSIASFLIVLRA